MEDAGIRDMTIGKLARAAGVGVETVRYYERQGLVERPQRNEDSYRLYPASVASRIRFIRRTKELGFTLAEIGELLRLGAEADCGCKDVHAKAEAKIAAIDAKIDSLQQMRGALLDLMALCQQAPSGACPLLDVLGR